MAAVKRREDAHALQSFAKRSLRRWEISHEVAWECDASSHRFHSQTHDVTNVLIFLPRLPPRLHMAVHGQ
jgi:hypothetical protein